MSGSTSPRLVTEIDDELKHKIETVFDFVDKMKDRVNNITGDEKRWYRINEAAKYLGVSRSTLVNTFKDKIQAKRLGKNVVYDRVDLDNHWLNN